jgi:hypothetical protein
MVNNRAAIVPEHDIYVRIEPGAKPSEGMIAIAGVGDEGRVNPTIPVKVVKTKTVDGKRYFLVRETVKKQEWGRTVRESWIAIEQFISFDSDKLKATIENFVNSENALFLTTASKQVMAKAYFGEDLSKEKITERYRAAMIPLITNELLAAFVTAHQDDVDVRAASDETLRDMFIESIINLNHEEVEKNLQSIQSDMSAKVTVSAVSDELERNADATTLLARLVDTLGIQGRFNYAVSTIYPGFIGDTLTIALRYAIAPKVIEVQKEARELVELRANYDQLEKTLASLLPRGKRRLV